LAGARGQSDEELARMARPRVAGRGGTGGREAAGPLALAVRDPATPDGVEAERSEVRVALEAGSGLDRHAPMARDRHTAEGFQVGEVAVETIAVEGRALVLPEGPRTSGRV